MGRKIWFFVAPLISLSVLIGGVLFIIFKEGEKSQSVSASHVGKKIPAVLLMNSSGKHENIFETIETNAQANRKSILVFWATWCEPCLRELPLIKKNLERSEAEKITYYFINYDEGNLEVVQKEVKAWLIAQGLDQFPNYLDLKQDFSVALNIFALPFSIGIDVDQKIKWVKLGELDFSKKFIFDQSN